MKILLFGRDGQLGRQLAPALSELGDVRVLGRVEADLTQPALLEAIVADARPTLVVNAAAYTAVDRAEDDEAAAHAVNALAPGALARAAAAVGAMFVHYSTDYVFDGRATRPYREDDPPAPIGVYGHTKWAGEEAVRAAGGTHLIFRTAWLYSGAGKNFLTTMLRLASERGALRVVADQVGSPTSVRVVTDATMRALRTLGVAPERTHELSGTYHVTCGGAVSWHGFASRILALSGLEQVPVQPIATADYPTRACRPAYSVLDNHKFTRAFGMALPAWDEALRQCMIEHGLAKQR